MKQFTTITLIFCFFLLTTCAYAQKVQIKVVPKVQPKISIPKVTKVHANSNSIIVPGSKVKNDKKKEEIAEPPVIDITDNKKRKKKG